MITVSRAIVLGTLLNHEMIRVVLEDLNGAAVHRPSRCAMLFPGIDISTRLIGEDSSFISIGDDGCSIRPSDWCLDSITAC